MQVSLNAALRTADVSRIFAAFDAAIHAQKNISEFAFKVGLNRSTLYRVFRSGKNGPPLDKAINISRILGFQFVVKFERQPEIRPNHFVTRRTSEVRFELRSNSKRTATYLTRTFKTAELTLVLEAFSDVFRAQENIFEFAEKAGITQSALYRAFAPPHVPRFTTVVNLLHALGLRLAVKPLSRGTMPNRLLIPPIGYQGKPLGVGDG
jgi:probable addiction module antidote protein